MAPRHEEGCSERYICTYFLVYEGLSNDDVVVAKATVVQEIRPGAVFKTDDFVRVKLRGLPKNDSKVHGVETTGCKNMGP